jgi:shikimate dehydrogenase/3-dehydroquinate dehydratase type I
LLFLAAVNPMPGPLVCETVTARSLAELRQARDAAAHADLVELRLDGVRDLDVAGALADRRCPVVVTCRPAWEGGSFDGSEAERIELLAQAVALGAEYVDVEWRANARLPRNERTRLVVSHHDFVHTPADLTQRVRAMRAAASPADLIKIAVTAGRLTDCLRLRDAVSGAPGHIAIAMGDCGQLTRVWPAGFGSSWTYGGCAAPGQIAARDLVEIYRVRSVTPATNLYGIVGAPLRHSASPAMHNAACRAAGLDAVYVPLESDDAEEVLHVGDTIGLQGASVTLPLKEALAARVAKSSPCAHEIGAVNTIRRSDAGWEGENFDAAGFLEPLDRRGSLRGCRGVVLGAGGAARAAAWALRTNGASVQISARRAERAATVARALGVEAVGWPPAPGWDLLVNATPVGTWPDTDVSPLARPLINGGLVYDLVYNPPDTTLMRWAREAGLEVMSGVDMLVGQACRQFEWWFDRRAPALDVRRAALDWLARHATRDA